MTMVYASPPPRRRVRIRDSQEDVETSVFVRPTRALAWRNVFLQPWTPHDPPLPWAPRRSRTITPVTHVTEVAPVTEVVKARPRRRRTSMPWVLFFAAFALAFAIGQDRVVRSELASELRTTTTRVLAELSLRLP